MLKKKSQLCAIQMVSRSDQRSDIHWVPTLNIVVWNEALCELCSFLICLSPVSPSGCLFEDELCAHYEFCLNGESHTKGDGEPSYRYTYIHCAARPRVINPLQCHSTLKKKKKTQPKSIYFHGASACSSVGSAFWKQKGICLSNKWGLPCFIPTLYSDVASAGVRRGNVTPCPLTFKRGR